MADDNQASAVQTEPPRGPQMANPPSTKSSRSKKRRNTLILIAALVLVVFGVFLWRYLSSYESTDDAQVDVHLYPVSARISGYVIKVNVGDNQWVQQGDVLVDK